MDLKKDCLNILRYIDFITLITLIVCQSTKSYTSVEALGSNTLCMFLYTEVFVDLLATVFIEFAVICTSKVLF